jgi:hypothetical protein
MPAGRKCVLTVLVVLALGLLAACPAPGEGYEKIVIPPEFERAFRAAFEAPRALEQFTATGTLEVRVVSEGKTQDLRYTVSIGKRSPGAFAVSVARAEDGRLLARVASTGVKGQVSLYLPRELVMAATPSRIGQVTDTYTLPVVITLFDFLDDGKLDRWWSLFGGAEYVGRETAEPASEHLRFKMNHYWTLRDIGVDLWVREGASPLLARMDVDLTTALTQRGPASWVKPGGSVNLSILFTDWAVGGEPDAAAFDPPSPPEQYGELNLRDVMFVEQSGILSTVAATADPAQLVTQLKDARASGGTTALVERLKKITPAQREQLVGKLRGSAANRARQAGVTPESIRVYNQTGQ